MGRRLAACAVLALLFAFVSSARAHDEELQTELLDEVLRLTHAGVPDHLIVEQIGTWEFEFELTADDIIELRTLGVSDAVIEALIETAQVADNEPVRRPYLSAGFYSPWYCFPYAWGSYYDPFPWVYSAYYYPFHYRVPQWGYYGWAGRTYYHAYHRRQGPGCDGPTSRDGVYVASHFPSRRVPYVVAPGGSGPRVVRSTPARSRERTLLDSRRAGRLRVADTPFRARRVERASVPARGSSRRQDVEPTTPRVRRSLHSRGADGARAPVAEERTLPMLKRLERAAPEVKVRDAGRIFVPPKEVRVQPREFRIKDFTPRHMTPVQSRSFTGWRGAPAPRLPASGASMPRAAPRLRSK